jgi:uroporphyrinogen-III synthase
MAAGGIAAVLIFSPRTARLFVTLLGRAGLADSAKAMRLVALSPRVATAASAAPWAAVETAPRPDLEAILETLARTDGSR